MSSARARIAHRRLLCALLRGADALEGLDAPARAALFRAACEEGVAGLLAGAHPDFADGTLLRFHGVRCGPPTLRVVQALEETGLACAVLKGAVIAQLAWRDPSLRPQSDVDVLVAPHALEAGIACLVERGLVHPPTADHAHHHHATLTAAQEGQPPVELHFRLSARLRAEVDVDELLARRIVVSTDFGPLPSLAPEDAAVYLGLHAANHALERLSWLVDLDGLARRGDLDWTLAAERACAWRVALPANLAWSEAKRLLESPIPDAAFARMGISSRRAYPARALGAAKWLAKGRPLNAIARTAHALSMTPTIPEAGEFLRRLLSSRARSLFASRRRA